MPINKKAITSRASMLIAVAALGTICACTSHGNGNDTERTSEERRSAATTDDTSAAYGLTPYPATASETDDNASETDDGNGKKEGVPLGSCSTEGMNGDIHSVRVNPYYDAGYERGYEDGYLDGDENIRENSYDSSCRYTGYKRRQYKEGYDEGYEAGFDDGYADSGGNPDDEE